MLKIGPTLSIIGGVWVVVAIIAINMGSYILGDSVYWLWPSSLPILLIIGIGAIIGVIIKQKFIKVGCIILLISGISYPIFVILFVRSEYLITGKIFINHIEFLMMYIPMCIILIGGIVGYVEFLREKLKTEITKRKKASIGLSLFGGLIGAIFYFILIQFTYLDMFYYRPFWFVLSLYFGGLSLLTIFGAIIEFKSQIVGSFICLISGILCAIIIVGYQRDVYGFSNFFTGSFSYIGVWLLWIWVLILIHGGIVGFIEWFCNLSIER